MYMGYRDAPNEATVRLRKLKHEKHTKFSREAASSFSVASWRVAASMQNKL